MRRLLPFSLFALAVALLHPAIATAVGGAFTDDDTSVFEADIEWLAEAGVTKGCNPPDNTLFCPGSDVTREQMAAFMRRFAQYLGAEDGRVSNADHAATADNATAAGDSDTLDGFESADFLGEADKAADSDQLDGYDSASFLRYGSTIPPLTTLSGVFAAAAGGAGEPGVAAITFFPPLAADIKLSKTQYLAEGDPFTPECPGVGQAVWGYFCAYEGSNVNMGTPTLLDPASNALTGQAHAEGAVLGYTATGAFPSVRGTWAVTAPPNLIVLDAGGKVPGVETEWGMATK